MNPPTTARPLRRRTGPTAVFRDATLRLRAELPAVAAPCPPLQPTNVRHDFLVPNPRPDLTTDVHTLRMIEAG